MRVLLFTGKGGVGKTTAAAATAVRLAERGTKALVVSTDGAHSLADALGVPAAALAGTPAEVAPGLDALHVQPAERFARAWADVQGWLLELLAGSGVDPLAAAELTVLPGAEEVLALLEVRDQVASGRYDAVVVDCAPTAETLRLLALPAALARWVERLWPADRRVLRRLTPVLARAAGRAGAPLPDTRVVDAAERLLAELASVQEVLADPSVTSARLVLTPEAVVVAEARRALTALTLHGYRVDGVVANRVLPDGGSDAWRAGWVAAQAARLTEVDESFAGLPVRRAPYAPSEPVGLPALAGWASQVYGDDDPLDGPVAPLLRVEPVVDGYALHLALPLASREGLSLARRGPEELVVTADGQRRFVALPSVLRRCDVAGAALRDGELVVSFRPDPDLWPAGLGPLAGPAVPAGEGA